MEINEKDWNDSRKIDRYRIYSLYLEINDDKEFGREIRNHISAQFE